MPCGAVLLSSEDPVLWALGLWGFYSLQASGVVCASEPLVLQDSMSSLFHAEAVSPKQTPHTLKAHQGLKTPSLPKA